MIQIKNRLPEPAVLQSQKVRKTRRKLRRQVRNGQILDFPRHWSDYELRRTLWKQQNKKCCYTEQKRYWKREADVEHFRPKAKVFDDPNHSGYWWLAYDWENFLLSAKIPNEDFKGTHFPLLQGGMRAETEDDPLDLELPVLIDPYKEDPEQFICYDWISVPGSVISKGKDQDGRGKRTIQILGLDDDVLNEERAEILNALDTLAQAFDLAEQLSAKGQVAQLKRKIRQATSSKRTFTGFRRAFFRQAGLTKYIADD